MVFASVPMVQQRILKQPDFANLVFDLGFHGIHAGLIQEEFHFASSMTGWG